MASFFPTQQPPEYSPTAATDRHISSSPPGLWQPPTIPAEMHNFFNLNNQLISSQIPSTFTPFAENNFSGLAPLASPENFTYYNDFSSQIPSTFTSFPENNLFGLVSMVSPENFTYNGQIPSTFALTAETFNLDNQFTCQIPHIFAPSPENNFSGLAPLVSPDNFNLNNQFAAQIPATFTLTAENNLYVTIPPLLLQNFNPNSQFTTFIPAVENILYARVPFLSQQENFNLNNQFTCQIPSTSTPSAEKNFSGFGPLARSENFNLDNQFTGQIHSPSPHLIGNISYVTIPQISVNAVGNPMIGNAATQWTENSMPFVAPMGPPEMAVNVGNPILGDVETEFDQRFVLDQKRMREISFQMPNQIQILGNDNTDGEAEEENEYERTGLLSDVISGPHKKKHWTNDEQKLFVIGLKKFGRGNWKSIAELMVTKSADQVASHAQKFFKRQSLPREDRKRPSIHDISTVDPDTETRLLAGRPQPLKSPSLPIPSPSAPPFPVNTTPPPPPPVHSPPLPPDGHLSPIPSPLHYQSPPSPSPPPFNVHPPPPPSPWPQLPVYESLLPLSPIDGVSNASPPRPPPLY